MVPSTTTARASRLFAARAWEDAYLAYREAAQSEALGLTEQEKFAWTCALTGRDDEFLQTLERMYGQAIDDQDPLAARYAFWLGFRLMARGEFGRGGGWLARCQRLADQQPAGCVERGYLLLPQVHRNLATGDNLAAADLAAEAVTIGEHFKDADLTALAQNLEGRARIRLGQMEVGLARIDEAMLAATSGELGPLVTGLVYCTVIATCQQVYAIDRAREWTAALSKWCQAQSQMATFTGTCLVHRSELMQLGGAWQEAFDEADQARQRAASGQASDALADAYYQQAEIHRLRGQYDAAERAYRDASTHGREPQPGLALLRLAQGQSEAAVNAIRLSVEATRDRLARARLLPAFVEILLSSGNIDAAAAAADEMSRLADDYEMDALSAMAAHATGAVRLAQKQAPAALPLLRRAFVLWQQLDVPFLAARIRVLIARACGELADCDSALLELDAARAVFERLGAAPDLAALNQVASLVNSKSSTATTSTHGLTPRELEVLQLVAAGQTNKAIAKQLFVSEKTVDRHVSNIFGKIDVATRAAATAFAYEHGLTRS